MAPATSYLTEHARDDVLSTHRHQRPYASLVLDGNHVEHSVDGPVPCEPGTLILHPAFHAHGNRFGRQGARVVNIELPAGLAPTGVRALQVASVGEARQVFEQDPQHLRDLIAAAAPRDSAVLHDWQPAFLHALRMSDEPVGDIARRLEVSAAHASRSLLKSYGMPPQVLRRELRWRHAMALLPGDVPLAEVAALAGFADQSHLTRIMRAFTGLPPAMLRRQIKCVQDDAAGAVAEYE